MAITHAKVSTKADNPDSSKVRPSDWNADHVIAAGTTGSGAANLGANCPASVLTAPLTWILLTLSDGSQVYVPGWKK